MSSDSGRFGGGSRLAVGMVAAVACLTVAGLTATGQGGHLPGITPTTAPAPKKLVAPSDKQRAAAQAGTVVSTTAVSTSTLAGVFFPDCSTVRGIGSAELRRGQPGYRAELDRDGDGIACESPPVLTLPTSTTTRAKPTTPTAAGGSNVAPAPGAAPRPGPTVPTTSTSAPLLTFLTEPSTTVPVDVDNATTTPTTAPPATPPVTAPAYQDCTAAAADGRVPLHPGDPGWNPALDVDSDGVACEDDSPSTTMQTTPTLVLVDCVAAWDYGVAPIPASSVYYRAVWDSDGNGLACEVDPRPLDVASVPASSTTAGSTTSTATTAEPITTTTEPPTTSTSTSTSSTVLDNGR